MSILKELNAFVPNVLFSRASAIRAAKIDATAGLSAHPKVESTPLTIGNFNLAGLEAPEHLNVGGQQRLAVHDFPGGIRTVQSLGAFPPQEISWEGTFLGTNSWTRAYELDRIRIVGESIELLFGTWGYSGKIRHLEIIVKHEWLCRYRIFFIPEKDLVSLPCRAYALTTADIRASMSTLSANNPSTIFGDTLPLTVSSTVSSFISTVSTALNQVEGAVSGAVGQITGGIQSLTGVSVGRIWLAGSTALQMVNAVSSGGHGGGNLISMASSLLIGSNIQNIMNLVTPSPTIQNTVTTNNPNLFQLAAQHYGDSSQWTKIASANGVTDPMPTGTFTLKIPK